MRDIEKTLGNPCNYVFCFDRIQAQAYRNQGFDTVYHLPLGINAKGYMDAVINSQLQLYGAYILNDVIDKRFVEAMNKHFKELQPDTKF